MKVSRTVRSGGKGGKWSQSSTQTLPIAIYQANIGSLAIDPRPLKNLDELEYIYRRIVEIGKEK